MLALYWDTALSEDKVTYTKRDPNCQIDNVQTMLRNRSCSKVTVFSTFASLAKQLFACSSKHGQPSSECDCRPLVVILKDNNSGESVQLHQVLQYLSSQFAHSPAFCVVLAADRHSSSLHQHHNIQNDMLTNNSSSALSNNKVNNNKSQHQQQQVDDNIALKIQNGAIEVLGPTLSASEVDRIFIKAARLDRLMQSRSEELRAVLGMTSHEDDMGINSMTRFVFLNEFMAGRKPSISGVDDDDDDDDDDDGDGQQKIHNHRQHLPQRLSFGTYSLTNMFSQDQIAHVETQVSQWDFYAHKLLYDELVLAAVLMFRHALSRRGLDRYQISESDLIKFVLVVREAYHANNPYHNFRHAIDVLQATFHFLNSIGALEDAPTSTTTDRNRCDELSALEVLTSLVVAIGHDVGHPGVTNAFLVSCNAPIARVYNDRSVLESFHSAAFLQILKHHWPALAESKQNCNLMIDSVLATDMAMHFDYMNRISKLNKVSDDRSLVCCILIKCADISNVARKLDISTEWGKVLAQEFAQVADLEVDFGLKKKQPPQLPQSQSSSSSSSANAKRKELETLAKGQLFFINTYARPLFQQVARVFPQLEFATKMIDSNAENWRRVIS